MTLVAANPQAQGGRVGRLLPALRAHLQDLCPLARLHVPATIGQALDLLESEPPGSRVVVIGGDGTLHGWLPALLHRQHHVGLVPLGSGNDVARALGLERRHWPTALAQALNGPAQAIDTGLAVWSDGSGDLHRTPFVSSLTGGFDSAVGLRALQGPRWLRGLPRYLWATLGELRHLRHWSVSAQADGQTVAAGPMLLCSVLNTRTYGSGMPAAPQAQTDDGRLDWLGAQAMNLHQTLHLLPALLRGTHLRHPKVQTRPLLTLQLNCPAGLPLAADGEWLGHALTLRVQVQPRHLHMVRVGSARRATSTIAA